MKPPHHTARKLLEGELVEVLQRQPGLRGSWYSALVVEAKHGRRVVEYDELLAPDGSRSLRETIPFAGDVGLRCSTRHERDEKQVRRRRRGLIRPKPPPCLIPPLEAWKKGLLVDAFYGDAWWEGVLLDDVTCADKNARVRILFPEEGDEMQVSVQKIRISQEWDDFTGIWEMWNPWPFYEENGNVDFRLHEHVSVLSRNTSMRKLWLEKRVKSLGHIGGITNLEGTSRWIGQCKSSEKLVVENSSIHIEDAPVQKDHVGRMTTGSEVSLHQADHAIGSCSLAQVIDLKVGHKQDCIDKISGGAKDKHHVGHIMNRSKAVLNVVDEHYKAKLRKHKTGDKLPRAGVMQVSPSYCDMKGDGSKQTHARNGFHHGSIGLKSGKPGCVVFDKTMEMKHTGEPCSDSLQDARAVAKQFLLHAGWTLGSRQRADRANGEALYLSPGGRIYYTLASACRAWKRCNASARHVQESTNQDLLSTYRMDAVQSSADCRSKPSVCSKRPKQCNCDKQLVLMHGKSTMTQCESSGLHAGSKRKKDRPRENMREQNSKRGKLDATLDEAQRKRGRPKHGGQVFLKTKSNEIQGRRHAIMVALNYKAANLHVKHNSNQGQPSAIKREQAEGKLKHKGGTLSVDQWDVNNQSECATAEPGRKRGRPPSKKKCCQMQALLPKEKRVFVPRTYKRKSTCSRDDFTPVLAGELDGAQGEVKCKRVRPRSKKASPDSAVQDGKGCNSEGEWRIQVLLASSRREKKLACTETHTFKRQPVLSLLLDLGILKENDLLRYIQKKGRRVMKQGQVSRQGVLCNCCNKTFTLSNFEAHAGSKLHRPSANIFLEDGRSLTDCQLQASHLQDAKEKNDDISDPSDDTCGVCGDGGELVLCDGCPSAFHSKCIGLEVIPEGDWYCLKCSCAVCGSNEHGIDNGNPLRWCVQCEIQYHDSCAPANVVLKAGPDKKIWCCGEPCKKIFTFLRNLVGISHPLEDGFSWMLLRSMKEDCSDAGVSPEVMAELNTKLSVAHDIMQECFVPMVDPRTKINLISQALYNRRSRFFRFDFGGFYTVVLEKGEEIFTVATFRVRGTKVAEMPLIGTRYQYRREGMCRRLMMVLEKLLMSVAVEKMVLPAVPELLETWRNAFRFQELGSLEEALKLGKLGLVSFPGTTLLQKYLISSCCRTQLGDGDVTGTGSTLGTQVILMEGGFSASKGIVDVASSGSMGDTLSVLRKNLPHDVAFVDHNTSTLNNAAGFSPLSQSFRTFSSKGGGANQEEWPESVSIMTV